MALESDKVMFEIYREAAYTGKYRVVYYTELNENNKEWEINRALSGEHFYDGFIKNYRKDEAKDIIDAILKRMNDGEKLGPTDVEAALTEFIAAG
jgi:thiaminase